MSFGHWEILVIAFIILLLFGARKLPDLARGIVESLKEFRHATRDAPDNSQSAGKKRIQGRQEPESPPDKD